MQEVLDKIEPMSEKIKLLFRHRSMEMGGVEKVMLSILNNLDKEKFDMTVCLNIDQGELRNEFPDHVRKVFLTRGKEDFSEHTIIRKIQLIRRRLRLKQVQKNPVIADQLLGEEYDAEIAMTYGDFAAVLHSTNKNSKKIGWFHSEINLPKLQPLVPGILKQFPKFDQMVYCSQKIRDMMHQYYPDLNYPQEAVIINAIPVEEIKRKADEHIGDLPPGPVFISIGRLHSRKGYHKLIEAHMRLIREGFNHSVLVVGDGEELQNLKAQIAAVQVEDTFILAGNKMNPYPYVKHADYFILPSESEAWPLVIAEALILQKPVIATRTGDIPAMIRDGLTGCLINYNVDEMYNVMKRFLTDPAFTEQIRKNLADVEEQFDNRKIFSEIEKMILNLVKK
ncbi:MULTISPECIES: glycosyltransferase [Chryseobacterium]|uniref:Glycosyltransferase involved in cell wall biosynthesis n=1 Tax=Chryseobacterium camelliae TaxID=1265445 RepID=A0ABU0TN88_9FLAO|nr:MULTISPECIES: glycosyltransferase [Chryseobacterium]MDT3407630.1 glycosyltransferase involved in cell wall biosynthesis [Pseudacidovorax intermedius]MDQ1098516.1 glycosyltransferase involved in cell wall biosynthesis [Chryseobacterium camelliae]MDQ1102441.1 glycosyltransferase involved in cell wall biosynthesis [Chryseobacterium sp. SORGH_AS_1048]MDR6085875.1 glycosyltransferase involved in cell wall biosynthesis [Chryseobacterium sp. SORGH_AS_0909]MDR6130241.1 glycosyltransferase involved 